MTSNEIYMSALHTSTSASSPSMDKVPSATSLLPDLATQVQEYINLSPLSPVSNGILYIASFGFWNIYNLAGLDPAVRDDATDRSVDELFEQLEILYSHHRQLYPGLDPTADLNLNDTTPPIPPHHRFRVIIPRLLEPTLLPGWLSQRPYPSYPSSVAEDQKNAVYLWARWNIRTENKVLDWCRESLELKEVNETDKPRFRPRSDRDVSLYDLPEYLIQTLAARQMEFERPSTSTGMGGEMGMEMDMEMGGNNTYEQFYEPCLGAKLDGAGGDANGNVLGVCKHPQQHLFWDGFSIGGVAKEAMGKQVAEFIKDFHSRRLKIF